MKTPARILFIAAMAAQFTSCGRDSPNASLEKQLRSSESYVTSLLERTIANDDELSSIEFSENFGKSLFLQSISNLESEVGEFTKLDLVTAKWNPAEFDEQSTSSETSGHGKMEGDNFRVMAVAFSGPQSGATLNLYLKPQGSSWTVVGMDAEATPAPSAEISAPVSQAGD